MKESKGSVLIISLIIMSITTLLSFFIIRITKDIVKSSELILDKLSAKIKAESEIEKLKYFGAVNWFDRYKIVNINNVDGFPSEIIIDGRETKLDDDVSVYLTDTSSKVNIYSLDEFTIDTVLKIAIKDEKKLPIIKDSFLDWKDRDKLVRLYGAEDIYYRIEKNARYTPRNNNFFQSLEELLDIRGIDNDTYQKLKKIFTFSYGSWGTNAYLTDPELLHAIAPNLSKELSEKLYNLRKDGKFKEFDKLTGQLFVGEGSGIYSISPSKVLEIKVVAKEKEAVEKIYCIIDFKPAKDDPFVIYKYKE